MRTFPTFDEIYWFLRQFRPNRGGIQQEYQEALRLYTEVACRVPQVIVEIGTRSGGTAYVMSLAAERFCPRAEIYCVDRNQDVNKASELEFLRQRMHAIHEDSPTGLEGVPSPFDLVHIDASHKSEDIRRDVQAAWGKISPTGIIVLHDWNKADVRRGATGAIERLRPRPDVQTVTRVTGEWDGQAIIS